VTGEQLQVASERIRRILLQPHGVELPHEGRVTARNLLTLFETEIQRRLDHSIMGAAPFPDAVQDQIFRAIIQVPTDVNPAALAITTARHVARLSQHRDDLNALGSSLAALVHDDGSGRALVQRPTGYQLQTVSDQLQLMLTHPTGLRLSETDQLSARNLLQLLHTEMNRRLDANLMDEAPFPADQIDPILRAIDQIPVNIDAADLALSFRQVIVPEARELSSSTASRLSDGLQGWLPGGSLLFYDVSPEIRAAQESVQQMQEALDSGTFGREHLSRAGLALENLILDRSSIGLLPLPEQARIANLYRQLHTYSNMPNEALRTPATQRDLQPAVVPVATVLQTQVEHEAPRGPVRRRLENLEHRTRQWFTDAGESARRRVVNAVPETMRPIAEDLVARVTGHVQPEASDEIETELARARQTASDLLSITDYARMHPFFNADWLTNENIAEMLKRCDAWLEGFSTDVLHDYWRLSGSQDGWWAEQHLTDNFNLLRILIERHARPKIEALIDGREDVYLALDGKIWEVGGRVMDGNPNWGRDNRVDFRLYLKAATRIDAIKKNAPVEQPEPSSSPLSASGVFSYIRSVFNLLSGSESARAIVPAALGMVVRSLEWGIERAIAYLHEQTEHRDQILAVLTETKDRLERARAAGSTFGDYRDVVDWFNRSTRDMVPIVLGVPVLPADSFEEIGAPVETVSLGVDELDHALERRVEPGENSYEQMMEKRDKLAQTIGYFTTYQYMMAGVRGYSDENFAAIMRRVEAAPIVQKDKIFLEALRDEIRTRPDLNFFTRNWYCWTLSIRFNTIRFYINGIFDKFSEYIEGIVGSIAHDANQPIQINMINKVSNLVIQLKEALRKWGENPNGLNLDRGMDHYLANGSVRDDGMTRDELYEQATNIVCDTLIPRLDIISASLRRMSEKIEGWIVAAPFNPHTFLGRAGNFTVRGFRWVIGRTSQLFLFSVRLVSQVLEYVIDHAAMRAIKYFASNKQLMQSTIENFQSNYNRPEFVHPIKVALMEQLEELVTAVNLVRPGELNDVATDETKRALRGAISNARELLEKWGPLTPEGVNAAFRPTEGLDPRRVGDALYEQVVPNVVDAVMGVILAGSKDLLGRGVLFSRVGHLFDMCEQSIAARDPAAQPSADEMRAVEMRIENARRQVIRKVVFDAVDNTLNQLSSDERRGAQRYIEEAQRVMGPIMNGSDDTESIFTQLDAFDVTANLSDRQQLAETLLRRHRQFFSEWLNLMSQIQTDTNLSNRVKGIIFRQLAPINQRLVHVEPIAAGSDSEEAVQNYTRALDARVREMQNALDNGLGNEVLDGVTSGVSMLHTLSTRRDAANRLDQRFSAVSNSINACRSMVQTLRGMAGSTITEKRSKIAEIVGQKALMDLDLNEVEDIDLTHFPTEDEDAEGIRARATSLQQAQRMRAQQIDQNMVDLRAHIEKEHLFHKLFEGNELDALKAAKQAEIDGSRGGIRAMGGAIRGTFATRMRTLFNEFDQDNFIHAKLQELASVRTPEQLDQKSADIRAYLLRMRQDGAAAIHAIEQRFDVLARESRNSTDPLLNRLRETLARHAQQDQGNMQSLRQSFEALRDPLNELHGPIYLRVGPSVIDNDFVRGYAKRFLNSRLEPLFRKGTELVTSGPVTRAAIDNLVIRPFNERRGRPPARNQF